VPLTRRRSRHRRPLAEGRRPQPKAGAKTKARPKSGPKATNAEESLGDQAKDIEVGLAKDLVATADGRRTLRTVSGTLLGKK